MNDMDNCRMKGENLNTNIRLIDKGFIYCDVDGITIKIKNPYDYEPNFVELVKYCGEYYIKNFVPKKNEK